MNNSSHSLDYLKYGSSAGEDESLRAAEFVDDMIFDYEKLMREECDCNMRKIPGLFDSAARHLIPPIQPTNHFSPGSFKIQSKLRFYGS